MFSSALIVLLLLVTAQVPLLGAHEGHVIGVIARITDGTNPFCGDGLVNQDAEECDDSNQAGGDGCSASCQTEFGDVVINEFLPNPSGADNAPKPGGEWVELYNRGNVAVDVASWVLYDAINTHELFITAGNTDTGGTVVAAGGFLVVYRDGDTDFQLNNDGDTVRLYDEALLLPDSSINPNATLVDFHSYSINAPDDKTFARIPDGADNWVDPEPTPGEPNELSDAERAGEPTNYTYDFDEPPEVEDDQPLPPANLSVPASDDEENSPPADEPTDEVTEPVETPAEETPTEPGDESTETPTDQPADEDASADQPTEPPADEPAAEPEPTETPAGENPADEPSAGAPADTGGDQPSGEPAPNDTSNEAATV